jgi:hypothetical protein
MTIFNNRPFLSITEPVAFLYQGVGAFTDGSPAPAAPFAVL